MKKAMNAALQGEGRFENFQHQGRPSAASIHQARLRQLSVSIGSIVLLASCGDGLAENTEAKHVANAEMLASITETGAKNNGELRFTTIDIGFPGATTVVWGLSSDGDIIGSYCFCEPGPVPLPPHVFGPDPIYGYVLSEGSFRSIEFPKAEYTVPYVMSAGNIVGAYGLDDDDVAHGFLLSKGIFTSIDFPGADSTSAWGINPAGDIVGLYGESSSGSDRFHGYLLKNGKFTTIDFPGATLTWPRGINAQGEIAGLYTDADGTNHGFLWRKDQFTSIDVPRARFTNVLGNDDCGDLVGRYDDAGGTPHGFLLRKNHFTSIDFPGAVLTNARGVNPRGEIAGQYRNADGSSHGYLLSRYQ